MIITLHTNEGTEREHAYWQVGRDGVYCDVKPNTPMAVQMRQRIGGGTVIVWACRLPISAITWKCECGKISTSIPDAKLTTDTTFRCNCGNMHRHVGAKLTCPECHKSTIESMCRRDTVTASTFGELAG